MQDLYNLQRFIDAQNPVYEQVCSELRAGCKESHWMWFVFPQLKGLGHSAMAEKFGISLRDEAEAYLRHAILGPRLLECTGFVNAIEGRSVEQIFGYPDDLKFCSSMTLFAQVASGQNVFADILKKYFDGTPDPLTLAKL